MIYNLKFFAGVMTLLLFFSCKESHTSSSVIDVASAMNQLTEIKASHCFSEIQYIPLETTDSSLVGNAPDVRILQNRILVSSQKKCMLFDKSTGKFIKSVGHIGDDPEGYGSVDYYIDEPRGLIYFKGFRNDLVCYDKEGNYVRNVKVPEVGEKRYPTDYFFIDENTFVGYYDNITGDQKERILFFDNEGKELVSIPNLKTAPPFEIANVSVFKGEKAVDIYGTSALRGALILNSVDPDIQNISIIGKSNFWTQNNKNYFKEVYNDTIYLIENNTIKPHLMFDLGIYHWDYSERFMRKMDKNIYIAEILESNDFIFFRFITGLYHDDKREIYNALYDKKTGKVKSDLFKNGLIDDINHFIPIQPLSVSNSGEYIGVLSAEKVLEWFDKNQKNEQLSSTAKSLKLIKEDDNPIIVVMRSK